MKQLIYSILFLVALISCQEKIAPESLSKINGYWEIQKVELPDGQEKEYKINATVDYFEWKNATGFRKKVTPQFDGTFLTNNEAEAIQIKDSSGTQMIYYKTAYAEWSEEIIEISDSILVLKNKQNLAYHYKRFTPFSVK